LYSCECGVDFEEELPEEEWTALPSDEFEEVEPPAWTRRLDIIESFVPVVAIALLIILVVLWFMLMTSITFGTVLDEVGAVTYTETWFEEEL
jgi:predicted anti-sigma-YlaC factor YlaD